MSDVKIHNKRYKYMKQWREKNSERIKKQQKEWYLNNSGYNKQYYKNHREEIRENDKQYYKNHREEIKEYNKKRYKMITSFVDDYKLSKGCSVCGYKKCANALDFHHNGDKKFDIGYSVQQGYSLEKIKKEMKKCDVLCANCHRELHYHGRGEINENKKKD